MAAGSGTAPTSELGATNASSLLPWGLFFGDESERVPELTWPRSIRTYEAMRNDAQIKALLQAATLPIRRYKWMIDPNGAPANVVQRVAEDFGLPVKGEDAKPTGRRRNRFSHDYHLYHSLLAFTYGFMFFEQVGDIVDGQWRLRKLAPRMPESIMDIRVEKDGGLRSIKQNLGLPAIEIPVNRLVAYVWEREGGNWVGRSMLRPLYKNWLIKDRLLRVDAIKHERNGVGIPVATGSQDMQRPQLDELGLMAQKFKAGESAGGAIPYGSKLDLVGVSGAVPDTVASIRYHDESMARAFLAMFIQLGQTTTGSRALGSEFIDYFALSQETMANWYCAVTNEHVIEDMVDWNDGEDVAAPTICFERDEEPELAIADFVEMVKSGAITTDPELEAAMREKYNLPEMPEPEELPDPPPAPVQTPPPVPPAPVVEASGRRRAVRAAESPSLPLPDRPLHRQPYEQEVRAAVDYAAMDTAWQSAVDKAVGSWAKVTATQVGELRAQIAATSSLTSLAEVSATPGGADILLGHMETLLKDGVALARAEAKSQGVTVAKPDLDDALEALAARAEAIDALLAKSLSETAGRQAINRSGGSLSTDEVAGAVEKHLLGLSDAYLRDQFGGAFTQALNAGRREVFAEAAPTEIYASELLDDATCEECASVDGTVYDTLAEAEADYPTGGYAECLGGPRCRGTLVAVYDTEEAANG